MSESSNKLKYKTVFYQNKEVVVVSENGKNICILKPMSSYGDGKTRLLEIWVDRNDTNCG